MTPRLASAFKWAGACVVGLGLSALLLTLTGKSIGVPSKKTATSITTSSIAKPDVQVYPSAATSEKSSKRSQKATIQAFEALYDGSSYADKPGERYAKLEKLQLVSAKFLSQHGTPIPKGPPSAANAALVRDHIVVTATVESQAINDLGVFENGERSFGYGIKLVKTTLGSNQPVTLELDRVATLRQISGIWMVDAVTDFAAGGDP